MNWLEKIIAEKRSEIAAVKSRAKQFRDLAEERREIRDFEPAHSLTDNSDDGLGLVRLLAGEADTWLRPGGVLLVEIGTYLSRRAQSVLRRAGMTDVGWKKDSLGVTRVVSGRRPR